MIILDRSHLLGLLIITLAIALSTLAITETIKHSKIRTVVEIRERVVSPTASPSATIAPTAATKKSTTTVTKVPPTKVLVQ